MSHCQAPTSFKSLFWGWMNTFIYCLSPLGAFILMGEVVAVYLCHNAGLLTSSPVLFSWYHIAAQQGRGLLSNIHDDLAR